MDFATRIILYLADYPLVDEGGRNSIRIQMENVKFSCHSFFCAHCRVVFSLCTSGPTDSHFISHSKLDMAGKWALPLGLLIEFIGRVAQLGLYIYFVDYPLVDEGGPIILLVLVRVAVVIYWVLITV